MIGINFIILISLAKSCDPSFNAANIKVDDTSSSLIEDGSE